MIKRKKTDMIQFKVRMLEELRKRLEVSAETKRRSLNAEIVARLEQSFGSATQLNEAAQTFIDFVTDRLASDPSNLAPRVPREARTGSLLRGLMGAIEDIPGPYTNETNEERQARLLASAQDTRKAADANDARGAHDMAARAREWADELERDAREIAHHPWIWSPGEMAAQLKAALGRTATGEEIRVAMSLAESRRLPPNPDHWEAALKAVTTMLARLAQLPGQEPEHRRRRLLRARMGMPDATAANPDQEPELPMPQPQHPRALPEASVERLPKFITRSRKRRA